MRNSIQYMIHGRAKKTCHPYSLKTAPIEQVSLTQSRYFSFQTSLLKVTSAVAAVALPSGCEQRIKDCIQSISQIHTLRLTVGRSWCLSTWHCCMSVSGKPLSILPVCQRSAVSDFVAYLHAHASTHTHTHTHTSAHLTKKTQRPVDGVYRSEHSDVACY